MTYAREKPVFRGEKLWKTPPRRKKMRRDSKIIK